MMGGLLYLTLCSVRNRARIRLRRLKSPRYLFGTIVGLAYLWLVFGRRRPPMAGARLPVELGGAAFLLVLCILSWIPQKRKRPPMLFFTQADVQFLFPAPLTRQELIRYKVLRSLVGVLIGSAFMTLVFHPSRFADNWMFFVGMALTMAILNLHLTGVSLSRGSLGSHGMAGIARQWLPLAAVVGAVVAIADAIVFDWTALSSLHGAAFVDELNRLASTGVSGAVMWPFRAVVRMPLAGTPSAFLRALPWGLVVLAVNYIWVVRSDARFEEASAEFADRIADIRKGKRASPRKPKPVRPAPFTLSLEGRAEIAILWKNLILFGRSASLKMLVRMVPIFIVSFAVSRSLTTAGTGGSVLVETVGWVLGIVFVATILLGPQFARNDLRQDLANLALLKAWPVDGATLVRGEVMAPAALLTVIAWFSAIGAALLQKEVTIEPSWVVAALLVAPGVILLQLLTQNAIAVTWPSLVVMDGASRPRGVDVMGQRMIMMLALLLVDVVALLPAAIVAALFGAVLYFLTTQIAVIVPAIAAALVLLAEAFLASEAIGKLLDRTDISEIDAPE
jgi:hypothetical protein